MGGGLLHRNRDFRLLWCGETAGKFGASVTGVAMPLVAVTTLHAGTFQVGLLTAAAWLPWLVIGVPVGVWVDRMRRRPIMLVAAAVSLLLYAGIPVAAWSGVLNIGLLLGVALLAGTAAVFFQTAYTAYLPSILASGDQPEGNAKLHGGASAAQIAGLGSGGLIAQLAGAVNGMFANAATFLVSLLCLSGIRHREPRVVTTERPPMALAKEVGEGLRLATRDPWFRTLTLFGATSNLALMGFQSILVVFLVREVGLGSGTVGALIAVASSGGVAGAFAARRVAGRVGTARATLLFEMGFAVFALLIPLTFGGVGLLFYVVGGFCVSAGVVAGNVIKASFQQRYCPPELLGRLTASTSFINFGTIPLGALLGGTLGTVLGLRAAMWITTAGVPLAGLILFFSPVRGARDLPTSPQPSMSVRPVQRRGDPEASQASGGESSRPVH
ncbi:MFS transporter [Streptomyces sp. H10-C2]|uniref:MFS transporter n=1 Tax=unclassified Streptomyces TaxID=2593676 RepID=UPI0024B88A3C|nr:MULTISPECIES: MFS transporter [unclassified Streptomyces]MDJ0346879.1 MFS transporter [Streptomyces sp. PH10-H1]MDJ0375173.1 MFS transporter [Streptomyces sp. H10-C2]